MEGDEMERISKVAEKTGVPVDTIRLWARTGQIEPAEQRHDPKGLAWYTTANAVREYRGRARRGRPPKQT